MKKKYSQDHNVVIFEMDQVVKLRMSKKDCDTTNNH